MNRSTRPIRRADLAVSVVLILLSAGYTLAQFARAQETANRVKCSSNLRQIGQAMLLYSNDNKGAYPRTLWDPQHPTPTWGTPYRDNPKLGAQKYASGLRDRLGLELADLATMIQTLYPSQVAMARQPAVAQTPRAR